MFAPARQLPALPIARTIPASAVRPITLEAVAMLCIFLVAGLIWLTVGAMVMRSGPDPAG